MKLKEYPGVSVFIDNRGKRRYRYRRKGVSVYLPGLPDSPEFESAYRTARDGAKSGSVGQELKAGTVGALVASYFRSGEFLSLKESSRRVYRRILEEFREAHGEKPVSRLPREWVVRELNKRAETPAAANIWLKRIRQLLDHGVDLGMITDNPARKVRLIRHKGKGFADWPEEQIFLFESHWAIGTRERLAFDAMLYSGQRRSDVVRMARSNIRDGAIRVVQEKTGAALWLPIHPALAKSIQATPFGGLYLIETAHGRPFTAAGFGNAFREWCNAAGVEKQYSAHGLRKAAARRLAEAGATVHEIAAVTGHKTLAEVARYTAAADQRRNAEAALSKIGTPAEQKMSSAVSRLSSKASND